MFNFNQSPREFMKAQLSSLFIAAALTACGGGDSGSGTPDTTGTAKGLWNGTATTNRTIGGIVNADGQYWFVYTASGNANTVAGFVQGTGSSSNGVFNSSNAKDYNYEGNGTLSPTLSVNYTQNSSLNGTIAYGGGTNNTLTASYSSDYNLLPSLASLAGTYSGTAYSTSGGQSGSLTVGSGGAITGSISSCNFTGTATPHSEGNAYDVSITFGASPCTAANQTFTGAGIYDAATKTITAAINNSGRTAGVVFRGTKP